MAGRLDTKTREYVLEALVNKTIEDYYDEGLSEQEIYDIMLPRRVLPGFRGFIHGTIIAYEGYVLPLSQSNLNRPCGKSKTSSMS